MLSPFSLLAWQLFLLHLTHYAPLVLTSTVVTSGANSSSSATSLRYENSTTTTSFVSGSAAVESCYLEWASWQSSFFSSGQAAIYASSTHIEISTSTSTIYSTYKLCDGIPRVVPAGNLSYTMKTMSEIIYKPPIIFSWESPIMPPLFSLSTTTSIVTLVDLVDENIITVNLNNTPTCLIGPSDCASLYVASSNAMFTGGAINYTTPPVLRACVTAFADNLPPTDYSCYVSIPVVQLIYWPVTLISQDLCVYPDPIDITATPSNTPIASIFGMNITSDENCYLSYPIAWALYYRENGSSYTIQTEPGDIVAVASSNLQSFRAFEPEFTDLFTYSFNFADLPPNHVPVLAYEGGAGCSIQVSIGSVSEVMTCATIFEQLYAPNLVFPTELRKKYPQWASCDWGFAEIYDPPTSLVPVDFLTPPSTASSTIGALPGFYGDPITPSPTQAPLKQASSTIEGLVRSSTAPAGVNLDLGSGAVSDTDWPSGDPNIKSVSNGQGSDFSDLGSLVANANPTPGTVVMFEDSGGSVAIFMIIADGVTLLPGQISTTYGQTVALQSQASSDTLVNESLNSQGSAVVDVNDIGEITVGGPAITLSSDVVLSAGKNGLVITSSGGISTVPYLSITTATSTSTKGFNPPSPVTTITSESPAIMKGGSSRDGFEIKALVPWLFVALMAL